MNAITGRNQNTQPSRRTRLGVFVVLASVIATLMLASSIAPSSAQGATKERADVLEQGGGPVYEADGALLKRQAHALKVTWSVATPEPGSYMYPTATMIPPGAPPHPAVVPGYPEVFTLWAFVFNYPELCSAPCNSDDVGDTPAQGGVFQVDATVADGDQIKMKGKIRMTDTPAAGVQLQQPGSAEVHIAMAPHGMAADGDDLIRQLSGPIGSPAFWFPAIFS